MDASAGVLFVVDGGKGLRKAIRQVLGSLGLVQRCRVHKRRNVVDRLPERERAWVATKLEKAWGIQNPKKVLAALTTLARSLEAQHPGSAGSLREGFEESVTINRRGVSLALAKTLGNTNTVESAFSVGRTVMRNMKRLRDGQLVQRWTAASLLVAEEHFRHVKGYKDLPKLVVALEAHVKGVSSTDATVP